MNKSIFVFLALIVLVPAAKAEIFGGFIDYDCVCSASGRWEAACPTAIGILPGGEEEPGINIRRCHALNPADPQASDCQPGTTRNLYDDPAPALTHLCTNP